MGVKVISLTFLFYFSLCNCDDNLLAVKDFLTAQSYPIKLTLFVCWKIDEKVEFSKALALQHEVRDNFETHFESGQFFLVDLDCKDSLEILQKANELDLFKQPFRWLIFSKTSKKYVVQRNFNLLPDSRFWSMEKSDNITFCFKYLYKYSKSDTSYVQKHYGSWTRDKGFIFYDQNIFPSRGRVDVNGAHITISFVITNNESLNHLWDYRYRHIDGISKLNYILLHHLLDFVNASKAFNIQSTWGYKNLTTGIYSGMIGDLQRQIADIGGTPAFFTDGRTEIIDFIAVTTPTRMKFIFRAPPLSYVANVFVLPFDTMVWYGCLIMVTIIPVALFAISKWEWSEPVFRKKIESMQTALRGEFSDVIMLEFSAVSQQGYDVEPKSISGRIATIFTFVMLMFLYTAYSAYIVALLQTTTDSIKTVEDLLSSRIKLGVEDIVYAHHYFENEEEPIRKTIYQTKIAPKGQPTNFMPVDEGIRKMRDEFFAFHVELTTGYKVVGDIFMEHQKCGLREVDYFQLTEPYVTTQKKSGYKEIFKIGLRKIQEHGIQDREVKRIYIRKPSCQAKGSNFVNVGLSDCYFPFLIFIGGFVTSIFLLLMEFAIKNYYRRREHGNICGVQLPPHEPPLSSSIPQTREEMRMYQ